jgi:outer membrane protein assembly factor BamB
MLCRLAAALCAASGLAFAAAPAARAGDLIYFPEGNRLHRIDADTIGKKNKPQREEVLIQNAGDESGGGETKLFIAPNRDVNGMICSFPDGSGRFLMGEDTRQPSPPPGWGVFERNGLQIGKLTPTYFSAFGEPYGCAFAPDPDPDDSMLPPLFTTDVGTEDIGGGDGQLILWFPPYDQFPGPDRAYPETDERSANYCKIASDIGTAGGVAIDDQGRVYVASASGFEILRFSPPFPTGTNAAGGCGGVDLLGSPVATTVNREVFVSEDQPNGMVFFTGLAIGPKGHLFAASVVTGHIAEYDLDGQLVRLVVDPPGDPFPVVFPTPTGNPQGIAFDSKGTLYYADLDLEGSFPFMVGTGDNGKIWRVRFKGGKPKPPELVREGLAFPDSVAVLPGDLQRKKAGGKGKTEWRAYAGGPLRQFMNPKEKKLKKGKLDKLRERWRFRTGAIITSSPTVARVEVPEEGLIQVVYFTSWDNNVYAVRLSDGSKLWHYTADVQPGAPYPAASSPTVSLIGEGEVAFAAIGETMYALDAVTGEEIWKFVAGTGCVDDMGVPPGLCSFGGERNQIESSPIVAEGRLFFGMDVNEGQTGKGGFFALDAADGRLSWYFDLETASTCVPEAGDEIRQFDGYHSEAELGLPAGFLGSRAGCDFDRAPTGCGNVWSSPAVDEGRDLVYFGSSNCGTDNDPMTPRPSPPMPDHDEALTALRFDGTPAWRWRPRNEDNDDLAFGATPNLFTIRLGNDDVDVVGIGGKDGSYYVLDRDGINETTQQGFDPNDRLKLPYWYTNLVPGGVQGGIIGTPAIDQKGRRILIATAQGQTDPPDIPQQPTIHALDLDDGMVLWQKGIGDYPDGSASFSPVGATPKLMFVGSLLFQNLRVYDTASGELLLTRLVGDATFGGVASGAVTIDGTVLLGTGIGALDAGVSGEIAARTPSSLVALCVPGSKGCPKN